VIRFASFALAASIIGRLLPLCNGLFSCPNRLSMLVASIGDGVQTMFVRERGGEVSPIQAYSCRYRACMHKLQLDIHMAHIRCSVWKSCVMCRVLYCSIQEDDKYASHSLQVRISSIYVKPATLSTSSDPLTLK
jgi:hypothetical protein